jgi:hypothetical protein
MIAEEVPAEQRGSGRGPVRRPGYDPLRVAGSARAARSACPQWAAVSVLGDGWILGGEPSPTASAGFAERLLEVIDSGRRTATYKLALLMALLDLCARRGGLDGRAPRVLYTREIAERVAAIYWPQMMPYRRGPVAIELRQISLQRSAITGAVGELRRAAEAAGVTSLSLARQQLADEYAQMLDRVEVAVAEQPLPRLQSRHCRSSTTSTGGHGSRFRCVGCAMPVLLGCRSGCARARASSWCAWPR